VGQKRAREIFFLGRNYSADEAFEMGMVNARSSPRAARRSVALGVGAEINGKSPTAHAHAQVRLQPAGRRPRRTSSSSRGEATRLAYGRRGGAVEGRDAFLEKRSARTVRDGAAADFDGDGDVDLLLAVRLAASIYLENDGSGMFTDVSATKLTAPILDAIGVAAADIDGDGDVDAFLSSIDVAQTDVVLRNDGAGNLVADAAAVLGDGAADHAVAFGDVDGDDDLDLVSGTWIGADRVLLNDGAGVFAPKADAMPAREEATPGVSLADLDDDGSLDVVFGVQAGGAPMRILYGAGDGTFTDAPANTIGEGVIGALRRPAVGDLDGDGRLDIAAGGAGSYDVLLQSSEGRFLWSNSVLDLVSEAGTWNAAEVADLDLDGDGDLVFAGEGVSMRFFENTPTGFVARHGRVPGAVRVTRDLVVADFTGDGAPDLLLTEGLEAQTELLASDGN
jgi:hypothetical protein